MNFSGINNQKILGKLLRLPLKWFPPDTIMPILQGKLRGKQWVVGSSQHGSWLGSYEYEKQLLLEQKVSEGSIFFDIGAHVGFYTLLASVLVGTNGTVVAFEPLPRNLFYLKKHLRLNHIQNVTVIEAAVSNSCGTVFFNTNSSHFTGHMSSNGEIKVNTVALDDLVDQGKLPIPTHLKIDVEGAEMQVLLGAKNLLIQARPLIFLALHSESIHQESREFLESLSYSLKPIDADTIEKSYEILAEYHP